VLVSIPDVNSHETTSATKSGSRNPHVRSTSLGSQKSGAAPNVPPPPLPVKPVLLRNNSVRQTTVERSLSRGSVSSIESTGSSILKSAASPNMGLGNAERNRGVIDFSQRHPEMGLGFRIREPATDMKNSLMDGPRTVLSKVHTNSYIRSSCGSVRENTTSAGLDSNSENIRSLGSSITAMESNSNRLSVGEIKITESVRINAISTCSDDANGAIHVLSTPKRNSQMRKVSAYGSPLERKRSSVLQDVSGNTALLPRDISQTSTQASSNRSSGGSNPFSWDPPINTLSGKPSALKGSPNAKKKHRRQNCVRISVTSTILGPPSRSNSSSRMLEIAEESPEALVVGFHNARDRSTDFGLADRRLLPRPPSLSNFEPK